ncbi:hypothetical protein [Oceanirhabdus sp. W0125-5]|uniref:hypothetical protein n=1 Tax=Oceanirhabdus sp. W0125-5 TaxID=2999116 RepID=UPI0022F2C116|nr:hypothetical protein [Oceanirhabdus sp. W0125-5]WBW98519.1 hypothetical protein OW730_07085 [Oceanirhabdus sp. W0125-5]
MNKEKIIAMIISATMLAGITMNAVAMDRKSMGKQEQLKVIQISEKKEEIISEDKAKELSKKHLKEFFGIDITEEYTAKAYLNKYTGNDKASWSINWSLTKENDNININIVIDSIHGELISMSKYNYGAQSADIPTISYSQAKEIAVKKMNQICKEKASEVLTSNDNLTFNGNSGEYAFNFVRVNQEVAYEQNNISFVIDGHTGQVKRFNINWDDNAEFPEVDQAISVWKAENLFVDSIDFNLVYNKYRNKYRFQDEENLKNIKLVYDLLLNNGIYIDAVSGKAFFRYDINESKMKELDLTEKEFNEVLNKYKELKELEDVLTESDVQEIAQKFIQDNIGKDFTLQNAYFDSNDREKEKGWYLNYSKEEKYNGNIDDYGVEKENKENKENKEEQEEYIKITNVSIWIDSVTGQIKSMNQYSHIRNSNGMGYFYNDDKEFEASVTWEEGYKKAIEIIGKYYSDKVKNLDYHVEKHIYTDRKGNPIQDRKYYYTFNRVENGIPFNENNITITIDAGNGELTSLNKYWYKDGEFVSPEKKLSEKEIIKIFRDKYEPQLRFIKKDNKISLVYEIKGNEDIYDFKDFDAFDGDILNYNGEEIIEDTEAFFKEIENSKVKKELEILAYSGLLDIREFELDKEVTNKELIKLIVDAYGYRPYVVEDNREYDMAKTAEAVAMDEKKDSNETPQNGYDLTDKDYIEMAKFYGIIDGEITEELLDEKVDRVSLAKAMIKFTGYEEIAKISEIFKVNAKDEGEIKEEMKGYVALSLGFNILETENGYLKPSTEIEYEELCSALYNALQNKKSNINPYPIPYYKSID